MTLEQIALIISMTTGVICIIGFWTSFMRSKRHATTRITKLEFMVKILWEYHRKRHDLPEINEDDELASETSE